MLTRLIAVIACNTYLSIPQQIPRSCVLQLRPAAPKEKERKKEEEKLTKEFDLERKTQDSWSGLRIVPIYFFFRVTMNELSRFLYKAWSSVR